MGVIHPNDWFGINAISKSMLEVTLRDPYTNQGPTTDSSLDDRHPASAAGDQCPPGDAWFDGEACVVAMAQKSDADLAGGWRQYNNFRFRWDKARNLLDSRWNCDSSVPQLNLFDVRLRQLSRDAKRFGRRGAL